jgi:4-oxalocrotonate tautomerase
VQPVERLADGEGLREVTWVRVNEFEEGDWAIGGQSLKARGVHRLRASKAA